MPKCLRLCGCVSCRVGSILMHHAFLHKCKSLLNSPKSFKRWTLTPLLVICYIEHFSAFSKTLSHSHLKAFKYSCNKITHTFFFLKENCQKAAEVAVVNLQPLIMASAHASLTYPHFLRKESSPTLKSRQTRTNISSWVLPALYPPQTTDSWCPSSANGEDDVETSFLQKSLKLSRMTS